MDHAAYQFIGLFFGMFQHAETQTVLDIAWPWHLARSRYASAVDPMSQADQRPTVSVQPCTVRFSAVSPLWMYPSCALPPQVIRWERLNCTPELASVSYDSLLLSLYTLNTLLQNASRSSGCRQSISPSLISSTYLSLHTRTTWVSVS
jgi:hypothetical protein